MITKAYFIIVPNEPEFVTLNQWNIVVLIEISEMPLLPFIFTTARV